MIVPVYSPTTAASLRLCRSLPSPSTTSVDVRGREGLCPVVVGVSDSGTTRLLPSYRLLAFYQWRARATDFHVYVRTPRDYAQRRTRDIVRRRETNVLDVRLRGRPVRNFTRRVSRRRILFARDTKRGRWNKDERLGPKVHGVCFTPFRSSKAWLWFRLFDSSRIINRRSQKEKICLEGLML